MSLAALLMGVANRAGEVNRRNEQRKYSEELYGKQAQSEYLMKQISDPSLPDEERQQHERSFEQLWGLKPGMVDFAKKMTPMFRQLVKQQAPGIVQEQTPSTPATPAGPIGPPVAGGGLGNMPAEPANIQPPLGALPRATPTLGTPPPPPPAMQAPDTELGRRQIQRQELMKQSLAHLRSLGLPPEIENLVIAGIAGVAPSVQAAGIGAVSRENVAKINSDARQKQALMNLYSAYGPSSQWINSKGQIAQVHGNKIGFQLTPRLDQDGNMVLQENGFPIMDQFNAGAEWRPYEKGILSATDATGKVTAEPKSAVTQQSLGGTTPPAQVQQGLKGKPQQTQVALQRPMKIDYLDPETNTVQTLLATPAEIKQMQQRQQAKAAASGETVEPGLKLTKPPTTYERANAGQGRIIINQGNKLINQIKSQWKELGPIIGTINNLEAGLGNANPKVRALYGDLKSFSALQPKLHGARGVQYQREFESAIGGLRTNPDALIETIKHYQDMAGEFVKTGGGGKLEETPTSTTQDENTKIYQGHTYKKLSDGMWHRQDK